MKKPSKSRVVKLIKITGIGVGTVLLLLFLIPILFPGRIAQEVKLFANQKLNGTLNFKEANLSFFNHFPSLTLTLSDFSLKGSAPYKKETLVSAHEISFGINLKTLIFDKSVNIDEIYVSKALFNVKVNAKGEANYNVYNAAAPSPKKDTSAATSLRLEKIAIEDSHLVYNDKSTKMLIDAKGFNYEGNGDLDQAIFDLYTEANIDSFDFSYGGQTYLKNKRINADLITKINTNSLAFVFQQNNLKINKLPVAFKGKFDFLSNGYDMDFRIQSNASKLNDFFTALPPQYVTWLEKSKVKGSTDLLLTLKGKYVASQNLKPDMAFNMKIRDGFISYKNAPFPASDIFLNFDTKLPSLDVERLKVTIDSVFFTVDKDYVKAIVKTEGLSTPKIFAKINSKIDLAKLDRAMGLENMDLRGILNLNMESNGVYNKKKNQIPVTSGTIALVNGYVKSIYYPNPIKNINVKASVLDAAGSLQDLKISITPASFVFEEKPIYLRAKIENFDNITYDIKAKGELDLSRIYHVFSRKGLDLSGYIKADLSFKGTQNNALKGHYNKLENKGTLVLRNIETTSEYLPKPFIIKEGTFLFDQERMSFNNFKAEFGQSDFSMNGSLRNVIDFVLTDKAILRGDFNLHSDYINVDEFMSKAVVAKTSAVANIDNAAGTKPTIASGVVVLPVNFDVTFNATAAKINFEDLQLQNLKGSMVLHHGQMELRKSGFEVIGCAVNMDLVYGSQSPEKAYFDFKVAAKDFDIKRAYSEVKLFHDMASAAAGAEGIISLDYRVAGILDSAMQPIYPSLTGGGVLSVKQVKMKGFKLFGAISEKTGKNALVDPDVTKVAIKTTIKNNIITMERFKFKVAGFRPRIEGQTSFDGNLNLKIRLGLPPLGIIGIPLKVTGTQERPIIRLGKKTEDLKETEYQGEFPQPLNTETKS
jgi:AsmA protein